MNEKKFRKKIENMTLEEKQKKDSLWQKVSLETGVDGVKRSGLSIRFALTLATSVLVICIASVIVIANLGNFNKQTAISSDSGNESVWQSGAGSVKDPNRFTDGEYAYKSAKSITELAKEDANILYVSEWERKTNSTEIMYDLTDKNRDIGVRDTASDNSNQITVNILYENIKVVEFDKIIDSMKANAKNVNGIDVFWRSADQGGYASFEYKGYTYFIQVQTTSGQAALNAAEALIKSKPEATIKMR